MSVATQGDPTLLSNQSMGTFVEAEGRIPPASEEAHSHTTPEHVCERNPCGTLTLNCIHKKEIMFNYCKEIVL